jgi:hypothetical protein
VAHEHAARGHSVAVGVTANALLGFLSQEQAEAKSAFRRRSARTWRADDTGSAARVARGGYRGEQTASSTLACDLPSSRRSGSSAATCSSSVELRTGRDRLADCTAQVTGDWNPQQACNPRLQRCLGTDQVPDPRPRQQVSAFPSTRSSAAKHHGLANTRSGHHRPTPASNASSAPSEASFSRLAANPRPPPVGRTAV